MCVCVCVCVCVSEVMCVSVLESGAVSCVCLYVCVQCLAPLSHLSHDAL